MNETEELATLRRGAALVDRPTAASCSSPVRTRARSCRRWCRPTSTRSHDGQGAPSLLLTPQGKLDVAFRLLVVGDELWLDTDPGLGAQLEGLARPLQDPGEGGSGRPVRRVGHGVAHRARGVRPVVAGPSRRSSTATCPRASCSWSAPRWASTSSGARGLDRLGVGHVARRRLDDRRARGVRGVPHRTRHPAAARRHRRQDDPAGGRARDRRGLVHQGVLPRPGARLPHRQPRAREPVPPALPHDRRRLAGRRRRGRRRRQGRRRAHERRRARACPPARSATCGARSNRRRPSSCGGTAGTRPRASPSAERQVQADRVRAAAPRG